MPIEIYPVHTLRIDAWIAWDGVEENDYAYGGARVVPWRTPNEQAVSTLHSLMQYESSWKNTLINMALEGNAVDPNLTAVPPGFMNSRVGGARCVMRPANATIAEIMADPTHPEFRDVVNELFEGIGRVLNSRGGKIKLTPDFGKFAGMADLLHQHTDHVLGVSCEAGGCGGKSSYSATGITAAFDTLAAAGALNSDAVTVVGSAGAMGECVLSDMMSRSSSVTACDLKYEAGTDEVPSGVRHMVSEPGRFNDEALASSDVLIATTWGSELENSSYSLLPSPKVLLLAHNLSLPTGIRGMEFNEELSKPGVVVVPGQILTLGGALTSRLEWFSRQAGIVTFDKSNAHEVVRQVISWLTSSLVLGEHTINTPYERLIGICDANARSVGGIR